MPSLIALVINIFRVSFMQSSGFEKTSQTVLYYKNRRVFDQNACWLHYSEHTSLGPRTHFIYNAFRCSHSLFEWNCARTFQISFFCFSSSISLTRPHMSHLRNHKPHQMLIYFFLFASSSSILAHFSMERVCVCKINNFRARQCKNSSAESF